MWAADPEFIHKSKKVLDGSVKAGDTLLFTQSNHKFIIREVGTFAPSKKEQ